jgi:hypothetical protein
MMKGDVSRSYRWFVVDLWAKEISRDIVDVWFYDIWCYWKDNVVLKSW